MQDLTHRYQPFDVRRFAASPNMVKLLKRDIFHATIQVNLGAWDELDEAVAWCCSEWERAGRHVRKHLDVEAERAMFEFNDHRHAIDFKLRFG